MNAAPASRVHAPDSQRPLLTPAPPSRGFLSMNSGTGGLAMPPPSIQSCGSQAYVSSYIPTSTPFPPRSMQDLIGSMKSYASATDLARTYSETPSVEEALATLDRAVQALNARQYRDALKLYLDGGYAMANVAEHQRNAKIGNLLTTKGFETLNWCGKLCDWIEGRFAEKHPRPGVHKVGILVAQWDDDWVGPHLEEEEAQRMWYTPVYCPTPANFTTVGNRLRCVEMQRRPRLMVGITIYNETPECLQATLVKLANNLMFLRDHALGDPAQGQDMLSAAYRGDDIWQNVLVCIIADGREQISSKMLKYLESVGLYDEDLVTINGAGIGAHCHLFEHTLQLRQQRKSLLPLQTVFALKETKQSKLDSHNWYFNAFAEQVQPEFTVMLDVGTMLTKRALYHVLRAFEINQQVGGVCGQLAVSEPFKNLGNWVVSAQNFEYKISNVLDKSLESCFGFISVLPGAFSAYRYQAIRGAPLDAYFQTLNVDLDVLGPFVGNTYLAEDRVLCFELLARKGCNWTLHYVKDAVAFTDVPDDLVGLMAQRKRWLNGSFFATLFAIWNWRRLYTESAHSTMRKAWLMVFYVYHVLTTLFMFVLPANVYLALYFIVFQAFQQNRLAFLDTSSYSPKVLDASVFVFNLAYIFGLLMLLIVALGNNPKHMRVTYYFVSAIFGVMMVLSVLVAIGVYFAVPLTFSSVALAMLTVGVFVIGSALHGEVHHILLTCMQYTALLPTFVNIFTMYSFCNLQDLSWGTKGLVTEQAWLLEDEVNANRGEFTDVLAKRKAQTERKREEVERLDRKTHQFEAFRTNVLLLWTFTNVIMCVFVIYGWSAEKYLPWLFWFVAGINASRLLGSFCHIVNEHWHDVLDKTDAGNGSDHVRENSFRHLEAHYAALMDDQRNYASAQSLAPPSFA